MRLVIVESPFAGRAPKWMARWLPPLALLVAAVVRWRNVRYARAAVRDCVLRGEAPIASHLLFTQPGILRDHVPEERNAGIEAGLAWGRVACATVAYCDRGISRGMELGMERCASEGRTLKLRSLPGWQGSRRWRLSPAAWVLAGAAALWLGGLTYLLW